MLLVSLISILFSSEEKNTESKQEKPLLTINESIIVSATLTEKNIKDCIQSVSVINENDLKDLKVFNLFNAIMYFPGIYVQRTGDYGRTDIEIRGIGSNGRRINIMVDGRPEKMGLFGCIITHSFPLDNISKIEIVKGAASVLYGSDAMGGVINIITKKPIKKSETNALIAYGSFNSQHYQIEQGGNLNNFSYYLNANSESSDGHIDNSSWNGKNFSTLFEYKLTSSSSLSFRGKYFSGTKYEPGPIASPLNNFWNAYKRSALDLTYTNSFHNSDILFKAYRDFGHHKFSDGWDSKDYVNGMIFKYTTNSIDNNELTAGIDYKYLGGKRLSNPMGTWHKYNLGVFVSDEYKLMNRLIITGGLRFDHDSISGSESVPQLGALYKATEKTYLRMLISKGFRNPQLNELYMFPSSNSGLKPELSWNYELGFRQSFNDKLYADFTFFYTEGDNIIITMKNQNPPPLYKFFNAGSFIYRGFETEISTMPTKDIELKFFYTYLNPGDNTLGKAKHKANVFAVYRKEKFELSLSLSYVAKYYADNNKKEKMPDYLLLGGIIQYNLHKYFSIFGKIDNILDVDYKNYVEIPGAAAGIYQMPGRSAMIGVNVHL